MHEYLRFVLALAFVLALMGLCAYLVRRSGFAAGVGIRPNRRMSVLEIRQLDGRHKLMLVKCDNQEHLLLLGPEGQTVVSTQPAKDLS